ncbi:DUF1841 family protein [Melioribacteraceae bacterium 4301-Me]|uniref:DUF1841 family protein n=1 Tax=Pyranulibacter aquaticus TaxID=3163344 RepID=UPI00359B528D
MEKFNLSEIKELSRRQYHDIWQRYNAGEPLEEEEKIIAELMAEHEEFYDDWNSTDFDYEYSPEKDEVNPFLHLMIDTVVMNQILANDPPQTRFTYNKLTARGYSHLEAIHEIAAVVVEEIWNILHEKRPFDEKKYVSKLKKLK